MQMNNDILFCIIDFLRLIDTLNCSLVNKQINHVTKNEIKWKALFVNNFQNNVIINVKQLT